MHRRIDGGDEVRGGEHGDSQLEIIASDCGVSVNTVKAYFKILYDTLLGFEVKPYQKVVKRKLLQISRFYYFDVGNPNCLLHRFHLKSENPECGCAFEVLSCRKSVPILGTRTVRIKSTDHVETKHKKGLQKFVEEHPDARQIIVSRDFLPGVSEILTFIT